jgi:hypothetical protein
MFRGEVAGQPDRKPAAKTSAQAAPISGGREKGKPRGLSPVCRPAQFVWQLPPDGPGPERVQSGGRSTADQHACAAPSFWSVCGGGHSWQAGRLLPDEGMSHLRDISTPCWLRKCSNSIHLPRTSAFQQAGCRVLLRRRLPRACCHIQPRTA